MLARRVPFPALLLGLPGLSLARETPGFRPSAWFAEQVREQCFAEGIRVLVMRGQIRQPETKTVRLVLYAAPNGNTLEQTMGCVTAGKTDWHFDLQQVAAQVRGFAKLRGIHRRLEGRANRVAIDGWHVRDGRPIQPLNVSHVMWYVDYSHGRTASAPPGCGWRQTSAICTQCCFLKSGRRCSAMRAAAADRLLRDTLLSPSCPPEIMHQFHRPVMG